MTTFLLVHGAFRGGWAWDPVGRLLTVEGHEVLAPSLTGMGDRAHLRPADGGRIRLATWVQDVVAVVETHDLRDLVLVGHSQGGMVTTAAATALHERIARLVYLDAPVPADGERGIDLNPPGVPVPAVEDVDLDGALPPRPVHAGSGMREELAAWVNDRLCATPVGPSFDPVSVGRAAAALPRTYVFFSETPTTYPCWSTRARLDDRAEPYVELAAGHDAPLTHPAEIAALLVDASR